MAKTAPTWDTDYAPTALVPLVQLIPAPWNPRLIKDVRFKQLCDSLQADPQFLWDRPIIANASHIIYAGNMRWRAAQHLGWQAIPARVTEVSDQVAKERALRDNNNFGEYEDQALAELLVGLQMDGSDLKLLGFPDDELTRLLDSVGALGQSLEVPDPQTDRAVELAVQYGTAVGQIWVLGDHRLAIGDCRDAGLVAALMQGEAAGAVVTDPPYGIERKGVLNDDPEGLTALFTGCLAILPVHDAVIVAFQSPRLFPVWLDAIRAAGHKFERMLWMYKPNDETFPWRGWLQTSEAILVSSVGKPQWQETHPYAHDTYTANWGKDTAPPVDGWHGSIKPFPVIEDLVSRVSGLVYEPFAGSGTTLVACQRQGRACRAVELSAEYAAVTIQRWVDATGGEPHRAEADHAA